MSLHPAQFVVPSLFLASAALAFEPSSPEVSDAGPLVHVPLSVGVAPMVLLDEDAPRVVQHAAFSLGINGSSVLDGFELSVLGNLVTEDQRGVSLTAGANVVGGDATGLQLAALANVVDGRMTGVQTAALSSFASDLRGVQLSIVNIGRRVRGTQIGLVNVAGEVDGLQLGLVNVARDADESVGLVSVNRSGYNHLRVSGSDLEPLELGVTYGGRRIYSLVEGGLLPGAGGARISYRIGLGGHVAVGRYYADLDASIGGADLDLDAPLARGRLVAGVAVAPGVALYAGPTLSAAFGPGTRDWDRFVGPTTDAGAPWLGATAGVRLF